MDIISTFFEFLGDRRDVFLTRFAEYHNYHFPTPAESFRNWVKKEKLRPEDFVMGSFVFGDTYEVVQFWYNIHLEWNKYLRYHVQKVTFERKEEVVHDSLPEHFRRVMAFLDQHDECFYREIINEHYAYLTK